MAAAAFAAGSFEAARSAPFSSATEKTGSADHTVRVTYLGHEFVVPASWQIVDLEEEPDACVRFDRHAVYLGTPGARQDCPAQAKGRTEALLIQPAPDPAARSSVTENRTARTYRATMGNITVTAAYGDDGDDRMTIQDILSSAGLPVPAEDAEEAEETEQTEDAEETEKTEDAGENEKIPGVAATTPLPVDATSYRGTGFDACTAPSQSSMDAWRSASGYRAVGIYIGGINRACSQTRLTATWVRKQYTNGWRFFPLYVGRQPSSDSGSCLGSCAAITNPVPQGTEAADDAVKQAAALGLGKGTVLYSDVEHYTPGGAATDQVLAYLEAYTERLHKLGYRSGAYGGASSLVADLVAHRNEVTLPDVIHFASWNYLSTTDDPAIPASMWAAHQRIHQYVGNSTETYGGVTINIDRNRLDVG
ncbi:MULTISPECIES: glycoside hydrolase domain-containing protein [Streptomyces]|uniref:DUF1906 domain-containing protein n=1 Tax=Streptomyces dengpaensis TaxID=2049881 RepID=A0ABN5I7U2_9ACTN|nr:MULTISPECIES: glycoside hydrolase domain-containing protein [Streptomyces]AVH59208.1 DUF1906 domain-containing protein [Streptomyces dengpaensis]PIB08705.1 hypothetical protein B1C81_14175 [Streptomyces sp. HG99]